MSNAHLIWTATLCLLTASAQTIAAPSGVRRVSSTSCKAVPVRLALGMTTQIVLDQEPKVTLFADQRHFKIVTNPTSPRSLAVIPVVEPQELDAFRGRDGNLPGPAALANALNRSFKTNLFVFFDNNNQLMFDLNFVEKARADYILKVSEIFDGSCEL